MSFSGIFNQLVADWGLFLGLFMFLFSALTYGLW